MVGLTGGSEKPISGGTPQSIDVPAAPGSLAHNLHASGDDVLATWIERGKDGGRIVRFSRLRQGRWSSPTTVVASSKVVASWADVPAVAAAADGTLVATWAESSSAEGHHYDAIVARSTDAGATWSRMGRLHTDQSKAEHGFVTLVPDAGGVRAFWLDGRDAERAAGSTQLRTSTVGATIEGETLVDPRVCDCCQTTGAATPSGAMVAYRDRSAEDVRDISAARASGGAWTIASPIARDAWTIAGCPVNGPSMAFAEGLMAVGWYTYANSTHRVRLAFSRDRGETFGAAIDVDAPRDGRSPMGRVSTVVHGDGAVVGWMASNREAATILVRRVAANGSVGPEIVIGKSAAGRDAGFPRLARTTRDLVIAWTEPGPESRIRSVTLPLDAVPRASGVPSESLPASNTAHARVGEEVPELAARTLGGTPASLGELRGRVALINVWATWCEPCRHEMPALASLHERFAAKGFTVVAVNVDRQATGDAVATFVERRKLPFPVWRDVDDRAPTALAVNVYPANILVGRDGRIRWRRDGAISMDDADLVRAIEEAIATPG
jgi:thiol-disulfide isomerase/thioredoxin